MSEKFVIKALLVLVMAVSCSCTTRLETHKLNPEKINDYNAYIDGIQYILPKTQFLLKVKYRITSCGPTATINSKLEVISSLVPDPNYHYVIDKNPLNSWMKATSLKVEYHPNMMLKSINATADDKAGPVISDVVSAAAKIATVAVAAGGAATEVCKEKAIANVDKANAAEKDLVSAANELALIDIEINEFKAKYRSKDAQWTQEEIAIYNTLVSKYYTASKKIANAKIELEPALKEITVERKIIWPKNSESLLLTQLSGEIPIFNGLSQVDADILSLISIDSADVIDSLYIDGTQIFAKISLEDFPPPDRDSNNNIKNYNVQNYKSNSPFIKTKKCEDDDCGFHSLSGDDYSSNADGTDKNIGLVYRYPVVSSLVFCSQQKCAKGAQEDNEILATYNGSIAQLGKLQAITFESPIFTNRKFSASFLEDGTPTMLEFTNSSSAESIASTFKGSVTSAGEIYTANQNKELKEMQNQTALLKAQKDLIDVKASLSEKPKTENELKVSNFNEETLVLNAEIQNIKAKNELEKLLEENN